MMRLVVIICAFFATIAQTAAAFARLPDVLSSTMSQPAASQCDARCLAKTGAAVARAASQVVSATPAVSTCFRTIAEFDDRIAAGETTINRAQGDPEKIEACRLASQEIAVAPTGSSRVGAAAQDSNASPSASEIARHQYNGDVRGMLGDVLSLFDHKAPDGRAPYDETTYRAFASTAAQRFAAVERQFAFAHVTVEQAAIISALPSVAAPPMTAATNGPMRSGSPADAIRAMAERGDPEALFTLGRMYEAGEGGLLKDRISALVWMRLAAEAGYKGAADAARALSAKMSPSQRAAAALMLKDRRNAGEPPK